MYLSNGTEIGSSGSRPIARSVKSASRGGESGRSKGSWWAGRRPVRLAALQSWRVLQFGEPVAGLALHELPHAGVLRNRQAARRAVVEDLLLVRAQTRARVE